MRSKLIGFAVLAVLVVGLPVPSRAAEIPLATSGGIYTVPVQVNRSITLQFLVDPGAGVVVIPVSVLRALVRSGSITQDDVVGVGAAETADRTLYLTAKVRLRELRIGNIVVPDVTAAVSPGLSQPLLGQSFLRRFASVTFDNRRNLMILSEDATAMAPQPPPTAWAAPYPPYPATTPYSGGGYGGPAYNPGYGR